MRQQPTTTAAAGLAVGALVVSMIAAVPPSNAADAPKEAPVFGVIQEGLLPEQAAELAERAGIGNALRPDGSFAFVDAKRFARVPGASVPLSKRYGKDEEGRRTVATAVNVAALKEMKVISEGEALERAKGLLRAPKGFQAIPRVDHTMAEISDRRGKLLSSTPIDTTVTFSFDLAGLPVVGPGMRQRVGFAGDGSVVQLSSAVRTVEQVGTVPIISPDEALARCTRLYGRGVQQGAPTLAYFAPALSAAKASGEGSVRLLAPHYVCSPSGEPADREVPLTGRMVPAAPELTPTTHLTVTREKGAITAVVDVSGGTGPYRVRWSSSTTTLKLSGATTLSYTRRSRTTAPETVTATVTDANGIVSTASVTLATSGTRSAEGIGGAGGAFAEVGIEQTIDEWQCAQDSANGFKSVMQAKGHTVNFDWRGASAWERDFKRASLGGWDSITPTTRYVDEVDAQWYTGHGWSGGFTFKGNNTDTSIVPSDARWGDSDLEWMQLESCQVLRDTNGSADYFARWDEVFSGLHLLNGFDTNAYCINGGTGRRFAEYLFPVNFLWWELRPALTVQQAWASMANDLEPSGVRWRSISPMMGGISNINDKFWGQGWVGPDISPAQRTGFIAISGVA